MEFLANFLVEDLQSKKIMIRLLKNGYDTYLVGGFVRDKLMKREASDLDICTSATPDQVKEVFKDYPCEILDTGILHGTVTLVMTEEKKPYEVTTFRKDSMAGNHRHPDSVTFISDIEEDLARRDFTINALALGLDSIILDPYGGAEDIENKQIRAVGNPDDRLQEDALRILRAIRFSSVLGFSIEAETEKAMFRHKDLLKNISFERISSEFGKILCGENACQTLDKYKKIIAVFIPEITPMFSCSQNNNYHIYNVWDHTMVALYHTPSDLCVRLSVFFHDIGKPSTKTTDNSGADHFTKHEFEGAIMTKVILKRLKYSKLLIKKVFVLIQHHDYPIVSTTKSVKRLLSKIGEENASNFLDIKSADIWAQNPDFLMERLKQLGLIEKIISDIKKQNSCFSLKSLNITGDDLISCGIPEGPLVGDALKFLLDEVIAERTANDRESLIIKAQEVFYG